MLDKRVLLAFILGLLVTGIPLSVYSYMLSVRISELEKPEPESKTANLRLNIMLDKRVLELEEGTNMTLTLTNIGDKKVTLTFTSNGVIYRINFYNVTKNLIGWFSGGGGIHPSVTPITFEPGDTDEMKFSWDQWYGWTDHKKYLGPGTYYVQAEVSGYPEIKSALIEFVIID